ncbi:MAG: CsbD family protein [Beijerinckiaceae bacterium]
MGWNRIEGNWRQVRHRIKQKWGHLTDDDLDKIAGRREQLEGKIQQRYAIGKDLVSQEIDDWMKLQH